RAETDRAAIQTGVPRALPAHPGRTGDPRLLEPLRRARRRGEGRGEAPPVAWLAVRERRRRPPIQALPASGPPGGVRLPRRRQLLPPRGRRDEREHLLRAPPAEGALEPAAGRRADLPRGDPPARLLRSDARRRPRRLGRAARRRGADLGRA